MKELATTLFNDYAGFIVLLHVLSSVVWVGGMIAIRYAVHPSIQNIADPQIKLSRILEYLNTFFSIVRSFIAILLVTATIMILAIDYSMSEVGAYVHVKEGIITIMIINFWIITRRRDKAQEAFVSGDMARAKAMLAPIATLLIPINILLGILAIAFGVTLRGY
jgi:uncharacterized membrane protein